MLYETAEEAWVRATDRTPFRPEDRARTRAAAVGDVMVLDADAIHDVHTPTDRWTAAPRVYPSDLLALNRSSWLGADAQESEFEGAEFDVTEPGRPGFGLAAAHTDQPFSLVITDTESGGPVACGNILRPDDDDFADAGLALVQLLPVGDAGVQGFALIERIALQRGSTSHRHEYGSCCPRTRHHHVTSGQQGGPGPKEERQP